MIDNIWLQWVLTLLFIHACLYSGYRVIKPERPILRYCHGWHLLMSLGMIAMAWPWHMSLPGTPQIVLYGIATLWFLWLGLSGGCCAENDPHRTLTRLSMGYHALMMGAMVWMLADMNALMHAGMHMEPHTGSHMHVHADMPMDTPSSMSIVSPADMSMHHHTHHHTTSQTTWVSYFWIGVFTISTLYYLLQTLYRLIRKRHLATLGEPSSQLAMALGMLLMIGAMV